MELAMSPETIQTLSQAAPFFGLLFVASFVGIWYFFDEGLPNWRHRQWEKDEARKKAVSK